MTSDGRERLRHVLDLLVPLIDEIDATRLGELSRRLRADLFRVLVAGEAKRGKSTLVNALLGRDVLPCGVVPLTAVTTTLRYGDADEVHVWFDDGREQSQPLDALTLLVTEAGNPGNVRGVREVVVRLPVPLLARGIELVDTPGTGSVHTHNTTEARAAAQRMDAMVLVLTADPPVSAAERDLLVGLRSNAVVVFCVLNKADYLDPDELAQAQAFTKQVLTGALGEPVRVSPVSARAALAARRVGDQAMFAASGLASFEAELLGYLHRHRDAALVTSLAGQAQRLAAETAERLTVVLRGLELTAHELADTAAAFGDRVIDVQHQRQEAHALIDVAIDRLIVDTTDAARQLVADSTPSMLQQCAELSRQCDLRNLGVLEDTVRQAAADRIRTLVDSWRHTQQAVLSEALRALDARLTDRLDAQIRAVRDAATELFCLDLLDPPPPAQLTDTLGFSYRFTADPGNFDALAAAVRTRLPGRVGRRRVAAHLAEQMPQLLDRQAGRARADFQQRLQQTGRVLHRELDQRYDNSAGRLADAVQQATALAVGADAQRRAARDRLETRVAGLRSVVAQLDPVSTAATPADAVSTGTRKPNRKGDAS